MKSRKGNTMVEAAIVFPVIILISMAVIYFSIYQFENFNLQTRAHQELLKQSQEISQKTIRTIEKDYYNSISLGPLTNRLLHKQIHAQKYSIDFTKMLRLTNAI